MTVSQATQAFVQLALKSGGWMEMDRIYLQNQVLSLIGEDALADEEVTAAYLAKSSVTLLDELIEQALKNEKIGDLQAEREILEGQLMDLLTPPPSVVNAFFAKHYEESPQKATDYFYELSKNNDYIKTRAIAKNIEFPAESEYGTLEITINMSKPEKDPKQIAAELTAVKVNYPKCMLCMENEGYLGRLNYPARRNHRIIRMNLAGESWGFQYSPYAYYNEHAIVLSEEHRPMKINRESFQRLLNIIEVLPHYFVGSNADLPIVGGSILSHDHYQAGRHDFPMAKAAIEKEFSLLGFANVKAGIVKWPMSVIRLQSENKQDLVNAGEFILESWRNYSDASVDVVAHSADGTPHHTITPIARKNQNLFELDLVLRDNNVSETYPDGIFHPHPDVQNIKKENIGLIEVMGLAILPPRLSEELKEVEKFLLNQPHEMADYHQAWATSLQAKHAYTAENVEALVQGEVGNVFLRVLEDAGVFKRSVEGQAAFQRFIASLG